MVTGPRQQGAHASLIRILYRDNCGGERLQVSRLCMCLQLALMDLLRKQYL
jgi:hypothetical protein